jgi:hypothetical protein
MISPIPRLNIMLHLPAVSVQVPGVSLVKTRKTISKMDMVTYKEYSLPTNHPVVDVSHATILTNDDDQSTTLAMFQQRIDKVEFNQSRLESENKAL